MKTAFRVAALFVVYSGIGWGGELAANLLADRGEKAGPVQEVEVEVAPRVEVEVNVEPAVHVDVRVRHSSECAYAEARSVVVPIGGAEGLRIEAGAGQLFVRGDEAADAVTIEAEVCASREEWLEEMEIQTAEGPRTIDIITRFPDRNGFDGPNLARIDLFVTVPAGFPVEIDDSSGDIEVEGTGDLRIDDSSGGIEAHSISGTLFIDDSSGDVRVSDVLGDIEVDDSSGGVLIFDVAGSVSLRDGSGDLELWGVGEDLHIERDGSGSIDVHGVGGDFVVDADGSGAIAHADVVGEVSIPDKKRRRRHHHRHPHRPHR